MCQYSSNDGFMNDWHLRQLGSYAVGGAALVITEATAVLPEGRITPYCAGLWKDEQILPLKRVVNFLHAHSAYAGIQLSHAGRKASTLPPFSFFAANSTNKTVATEDERGKGWPNEVVGPCAQPFSPAYPSPQALTEEGIHKVVCAFVSSAKRAKEAGFDLIEIHGAHGYLISTFLSPVSNKRTDRYGGSLENRMRMLLEIVQALRHAEVWPAPRALSVRLSCSDWVEGGISVEEIILISQRLQQLGVNLLDCSSGGVDSKQKIPVGPGFQVPFASAIKNNNKGGNLRVGAVGLLTEPEQCEEVLVNGDADLVILARQFLREPYFPLRAAHQLGVSVSWVPQNERGLNSLARDYFSGKKKVVSVSSASAGKPLAGAPVASASPGKPLTNTSYPSNRLALAVAAGFLLGVVCSRAFTISAKL
eukprot:gb/GEZN01007212.1/.p1 GENE.gb/GEZN01007212.1/~~gb/GEZN01007212.1/.p1  ORF type:complete len:481 (-),score=52.75 gb/GEZN01007212.1/:123-1385(-)